MRVVVTGANSAVGQAILRIGSSPPASGGTPPTLVAAVRSERAEQQLPPLPRDRIARIGYDDPASLTAAFSGATAVVHLAGTLVERPGSTYEQANVETTRAVAQAAAQCGVEKLVLVSAVGADAASPNRYWRTKGEAEAIVRAGPIAHTVIRAPLILGPGTEGTAALRRHLRRSTAMLPGGGRNRQQPIDVDDLARAVLHAAAPDVARNRTLDLVGPESVPDREILTRAARVLGREVRIRSMPVFLLRSFLVLRGLVGRAGFSADVLDVITADTQRDPRPAADAVGIQLTALDDMIRRGIEPRTESES